MMWSLHEIIHIWTAVVDESEEWSSQLIFQIKQLERRSLKKSGLQQDSNPWPPRYRCDVLPTELWSHTLGARSILTSHHFTSHGKIWTQLIDLAPNVWLHSSVGRASHRYRGGHWFESRWSPDFFRLLLSNYLNWKINCDDHSSLSVVTNVTQLLGNLWSNKPCIWYNKLAILWAQRNDYARIRKLSLRRFCP